MTGTADSQGAKVTIRRDAQDDIGHRQIYARLDSGETQALRFGDVVTLDLAPGAHVLKVNNTLYWKTVRFSVASGEHAEYVLANRVSSFGFGALALLGVGPLALNIQRIDGQAAARRSAS